MSRISLTTLKVSICFACLLLLFKSSAIAADVNVTTNIPVTLTVQVKPEKRIPNANNDALQFSLQIRPANSNTTLYTSSLTSNSEGLSYVGKLNGSFSNEKYDIAIKGSSHLKKIYRDLDLGSSNEMLLNLTNAPLLAGDVDPAKDNIVNIDDVNYMANYLYTNDLTNDLNRDGIVNSLDLSILSANYNKNGDN